MGGVIYAAAPVAGEAGWGFVWADPHEQSIAQEDGSDKTVTINEANCIKMAADGKRPAGGLWIGKQKYTIARSQPMDVGGQEKTLVFCAAPKKGAIIAKHADHSIIVALYSEEKGQVAGNASKAVAAFLQYLIENP